MTSQQWYTTIDCIYLDKMTYKSKVTVQLSIMSREIKKKPKITNVEPNKKNTTYAVSICKLINENQMYLMSKRIN